MYRKMKYEPPTAGVELKACYEIARLVGGANDLETTLNSILKVLHDTLRMERATLLLLEEDGQKLSIKASYGLSKEEMERGVYRPHEGVTGKIFSSVRPFVIPDLHGNPLFLNRTRAREITKGQISFIGVPVLLNNHPVGVLTVDRLFGQEVEFEEDVRFLTIVAALVAQFLHLRQAINQEIWDLKSENLSLKAELGRRLSSHDMIGQSKAMQEVYLTIDKVAPSNATVLLLGESGTGKELVARAIHRASVRSNCPFLKVNCAALPENLLESELFGHERGAFTGATRLKKGRFELADGGTLFLDEVGEVSLEVQAKLLRVLQERQFERLGGTSTVTVDVRLIAATNRSLKKSVEEGSFRADLFYRLNVVPVKLPPLRDRREDVLLLLDHFLKLSNSNNGKDVRLSKEVIDLLRGYSWPGNVRELQNLVERLVIMADGRWVTVSDLPSFIHAPREEDVRDEEPQMPVTVGRADHTGGGSLAELERREVEAALKRNGWVQARAARALGLTQRQIGYRIKKYGLRPGA